MNDPLAIFRNPPRRLSVHDPDSFEVGPNIEIWLDGYEQKKVLAYDCDAGTVERVKVSGFGEVVVEGDEFARETVTGDVQVRWKVRP